MQQPRGLSVLKPFVTMVLFIIAVFYILNVFNTGNWLWFLTNTTASEPTQIIIVDEGQRTTLQPGQPGFTELAAAAEISLQRLSNTDLITIGLSEQTLEEYASNAVVMELHYGRPITINSMARTGKPTQLLIPIEGRHAGSGYVFRGADGEWWFGAVRMANPAPLMNTLAQLGYTTAVSNDPG